MQVELFPERSHQFVVGTNRFRSLCDHVRVTQCVHLLLARFPVHCQNSAKPEQVARIDPVAAQNLLNLWVHVLQLHGHLCAAEPEHVMKQSLNKFVDS